MDRRRCVRFSFTGEQIDPMLARNGFRNDTVSAVVSGLFPSSFVAYCSDLVEIPRFRYVRPRLRFLLLGVVSSPRSHQLAIASSLSEIRVDV